MSATNHSKRALKIMFHRIGIYMLRNITLANVEDKGVFKGGGGLGGSNPPPQNFRFFLKSEGKERERKRKKKDVGGGGGGVTS